MKYFFYLCAALLALGGLLGGCRTARDTTAASSRAEGTDLHSHQARHAEPYTANSPAEKSTETPKNLGQSRRLFGLLPPKNSQNKLETHNLSGPETHTNATQMPRKCKGCTIVYGTATVAGKKATVATDGASVKGDTKAKGGAQVSQDSSNLAGNTGAGNVASTKGNNNAIEQTKRDTETGKKTAIQALIDNLTGPLGYVLALGVIAGALLLWGRKKATNTLS